MYHSVNMSYALISKYGELEDLKPLEKYLRSEEVTILSKFVFPSGSKTIGGFQWMRFPTPWSHISPSGCYSGFHHSRGITLCMAFPCLAADSLDPMDHFLSFDVSLIIPKSM